MGRTLTNNTSLAYSIETSLGVAGTTWFLMEPNEIGTFGADITTVARDPISKNRQRRKGTVTDLDSSVEWDEDLTITSFRNFIEGFVFANGINREVTDIATSAAETTGDSFTVAALTAAQANKMEIDTLVWATGFVDSANNGLHVVDTDAVASDTAIAVATNLVDETTSAQVSLAGHRIAIADTVTWTWSAGAAQATLNETGIATALAALGLTVGQMVHIGSPDSAGAVQNAFENAAADDMFGYARVRSFSGADDVIFDKVATALQFTDGTDPGAAVDILFGEFIRNVPVDDADFLERSFQIEAEFPNLGAGGTDEYEYSIGNLCNTATFNLPLADKATVSFGLVGTDTETPVDAASRKVGASSASNPLRTGAFNTSSDILRLRIQDVDDTGLTTDFKSITMTLSNNVSPEKVLGKLGAKFMNTGNFEVELESQLLFTNSDVIARVKGNITVSMDFVLRNSDGAIAVDLPSMTLGGGGKEFPVNESVLINTTGSSFLDDTFNTSIGVSIFPVVPST